MENIKLTKNEITEQIIQAGIQAIPYIGGTLASAYFGPKNEIRFKRLESFYKELADEIRNIKDVKQINKEVLESECLPSILEKIHDNIELEPLVDKRDYYKSILKHTIFSKQAIIYEKSKLFIDAIDKLLIEDIKIIKYLYDKDDYATIKEICNDKIDEYEVLGTINRLKNYGFIGTYSITINAGGGIDRGS